MTAPSTSSRGEEAIRTAIAAAETAGETGAGRDLRLAQKLMNDSGNGERFRARHGRNFLYVPELGWLWWSGARWSHEEGERQAGIAAQKTAVAIFDEADACAEAGDDQAAKRLRRWAIESGNRARLAAMLAVSEVHLTRHLAMLDADPWLFNAQNHTLELGDAPLRARRHARLDLISRIAPIGYDPEATCPRFRDFLDRIVPDRDIQGFLQRLFGYALSGDGREQILVLLWGTGANGKSTLINLLRWLYGDYATVINFETLIEDTRRRGSEASPDLAALPGVRAVFAAEPKKGVKLDEGRIKLLTGGEPLKARHLNRDFFEFQPIFKLVLSFNNKPRIEDQTHGMWRRILLVPFKVEIPDAEIDRELLDKLKGEGPGILNWCLDGFRLWRETGLAPPEIVRRATRAYRQDSDPIGQYLAAATVARTGARVKASELYACYEGWCRFLSLDPVSQSFFGRVLSERGFERVTSNGVWRIGLEFQSDIEWDWGPPAA